jgi:hypothetical protein
MSVRKSQDLKREKIAKGQIIRDPSTQPGVTAASNDDSFIPSTEWQDVPDWAVLPNGAQYRTNIQTGVNQARWDEPVPGPETVIDKRRLGTPPPQAPSPQVASAPISNNGAQAPSKPNFILCGPLKKAPPGRQAKKIDLVLPSGFVTFTEAANKVFPALAARRRYFVRDRLLVEVAYKKLMKDKQLHDVFQLLEPDALRSRLEEDFNCWVWRQDDGKYVKKPGRCTNDSAKVLLKTDAAFEHLPAISFLSAQPVFVEWTQSLDWIVQNLFGLAPLLDGHVEEVLRVSDPALPWLRQVSIAVERENRLEEALLASEIVDICQARGIDFPNKILTIDPDQLAMYTGRLLSRVFRDIPAGEELGIDRYKVRREAVKQQRAPQAGGDFQKTYYWFRKRP